MGSRTTHRLKVRRRPLRSRLVWQSLAVWLLNHPSRLGWVLIELLGRPVAFRRRFVNAWWQLRHYGDTDAFDALWRTFDASRRAGKWQS